MIRRIGLAVLAATFVGAPVLATSAQAQTYRVTSIHQIAPNTLKYLLSHWSGAGSLEAKLRQLETKLSADKGSLLEGPTGAEGKEGPAGARGEKGESITGPTGSEGAEGAEGKASSIAGPAGERGEAGPAGPAGESLEGPPGPAGESITGPQGERGEPCKVSAEPACASTVPGPAGPAGPAGPQGEAGPTGATGPEGKATAFITTSFEGGHFFSNGEPAGHNVLFKELPAGQYVITGSISFVSLSSEERPAELQCTTKLGGQVIASTPDIISKQGSAAAIIVASTGETGGGRLEVYCEPISQTVGLRADEETVPSQASLAATGVRFN
jgi:hypothetical protein